MSHGHNGPAVTSAGEFLLHSLAALEGEVRAGKYPDLRAAVQQQVTMLGRSREWVARQTQTKEGYAALVKKGFAEILIVDALNGALLAFYERMLYLSDPETQTPHKAGSALKKLLRDVKLNLHRMHVLEDGSVVTGGPDVGGYAQACMVCHGQLEMVFGQCRNGGGVWSGSFGILKCVTCGTCHQNSKLLNELLVLLPGQFALSSEE